MPSRAEHVARLAGLDGVDPVAEAARRSWLGPTVVDADIHAEVISAATVLARPTWIQEGAPNRVLTVKRRNGQPRYESR